MRCTLREFQALSVPWEDDSHRRNGCVSPSRHRLSREVPRTFYYCTTPSRNGLIPDRISQVPNSLQVLLLVLTYWTEHFLPLGCGYCGDGYVDIISTRHIMLSQPRTGHGVGKVVCLCTPTFTLRWLLQYSSAASWLYLCTVMRCTRSVAKDLRHSGQTFLRFAVPRWK